jgi:peptide/nickel transport system permease protein
MWANLMPPLLSYVLRRVLAALMVLVLVSAATRGLLNAMPGDPIDSLRKSSPRPLAPADLERLKRYYGLDDPFLIQYLKWLRQVAHGDLGYSLTYRVPVGELLWPALARTVVLMGSAFALATLLAILLGVHAATASGSPDDWLIRLLCYLGISMPSFWLCLVAIHWLAVRWRWLPPDAQELPGESGGSVSQLVLPVAIVAVQLAAEWTRYVRSGVCDLLGADYLRAARARGIGEARLLWVHTLPAALVPFLTVLGLSLPYVVGGELVVEMVFGWPGLGQLEYHAIREQDHQVAMATLLMIATVTLAGSLGADLLHAAIDPRVRRAEHSAVQGGAA